MQHTFSFFKNLHLKWDRKQGPTTERLPEINSIVTVEVGRLARNYTTRATQKSVSSCFHKETTKIYCSSTMRIVYIYLYLLYVLTKAANLFTNILSIFGKSRSIEHHCIGKTFKSTCFILDKNVFISLFVLQICYKSKIHILNSCSCVYFLFSWGLSLTCSNK